jgi:hypothetical protein
MYGVKQAGWGETQVLMFLLTELRKTPEGFVPRRF